MEIQVNGEPHALPPGTTIAGLLEGMELTGKRLAVEINAEIVPRGGFGQHELRDGDRVEIVQAIGGG